MRNSEGIGAKRTQHNAFLWVALTQRLASTVARQVVSQSTMKFASCDDPGNSVNAYLWVGVQGVVALSLLFAPIFLRTQVK
ncbi:hypothetical protein MAL08_09880 [Leptospira noguchii]|uniref:hypothetical protein n=1 Tax=Leptospira noguchii TaxID=28182 RepID=UPI001FB69B5C|nr:hypothetical protein [Leptospira noguchii]UOG36453.1 hypothetical protein MAL08_09880 [Leptospira noguchii]